MRKHIKYESMFYRTLFFYRATHLDGRKQIISVPHGSWIEYQNNLEPPSFEWLPCPSREATNKGKDKPVFP